LRGRGTGRPVGPFGSIRYNAIGPYLKKEFGCRIAKLSLDGGFTCPNRDGRCGTGGCLFCAEDGSGRFASDIPHEIELTRRKWPEAKYIAYFQNFTNTYAPVERLRSMWDEALGYSDNSIVGLAVATRPDCLPEDVLDLLSEYNEKTFLCVELGLQISNQKTADYINRCYENEVYEKAAAELERRGIRYVTHLILGLPGESREDMLRSAEYVNSFDPFGLKLHMLHVMENTRLGEMYKDQPFELLSLDDYVGIVCDIRESTPREVTVHRLTGDAPQDALIAPEWTRNKHTVLNAIQQEFKRRGTYQGFYKY
jgi:radical SAM protein (TIGR01212 family)